MATITIPTTTAAQAEAQAKLFISRRTAESFVTDTPQLDAEAGVWRVPVLFDQIFVGRLGQVGEILVSLATDEIVAHTPVMELQRAAHRLLKQYRKATAKPDEPVSPPEIRALAEANLFLSDNLPDRFAAGFPTLDEEAGVWRVPVLLAYPFLGSVGQTGEILIGTDSEEVVSYTPLEEMKAAARGLYEQHREAIEAPLPSTREALFLRTGVPADGAE